MTSLTLASVKCKRHIVQHSVAIPGVLDAETILEISQSVGHRGRRCFWNPAIVILTFLRQVLAPNCACRHAVAMTLAEDCVATSNGKRSSLSAIERSAEPGAYSQARQRLPLALFAKLARHVADNVYTQAHRWRGHHVWIVDGSGISMPDTPDLQNAFPQPVSQKPGCGFPVANMVGLFCWSTGALVHLAIDSRYVGELNLFRRLFQWMRPNDVVVGDRLYGNYHEMAALSSRGVHAVCRINRARKVDHRRGCRLGKGDRLVTWQRPKQSACGISQGAWQQLPETITLRIVRMNMYCKRAWRPRRIELVTTLLDPVADPTKALSELYRERWLAEIDLRSLKTTLGMDVLRCKSVEMVRKEIAMHQIAYNLIRLWMQAAAGHHGVDPQRLSFAGTQQRLLAVLPMLPFLRTRRAQREFVLRLLSWIAADTLPYRPSRHEPRAIKRRRKSFPWLVHPREQARKTNHYDKR